ncbi:MAG TPA: hypothetical protein VG125_26455 [Pirellulales bacterium]|nr:hypothetical protein [Pirellulales bacterium]
MNKSLTPLGKMTAFYIPAHKIDAPPSDHAPTPRATIHQFLMEHFRAYTHAPSLVKGFWLDERGQLVHDVLERFEVSFEEERNFEQLVSFLRRIGASLGEASIYITRGDESFLVHGQ